MARSPGLESSPRATFTWRTKFCGCRSLDVMFPMCHQFHCNGLGPGRPCRDQLCSDFFWSWFSRSLSLPWKKQLFVFIIEVDCTLPDSDQSCFTTSTRSISQQKSTSWLIDSLIFENKLVPLLGHFLALFADFQEFCAFQTFVGQKFVPAINFGQCPGLPIDGKDDGPCGNPDTCQGR